MDNDLTEGLSDAEHEKVVDHVNASFLRDRERWDEGYIARNSENLRKRVLAHNATTNGHSNGNASTNGFSSPLGVCTCYKHVSGTNHTNPTCPFFID